MNYLDSGYNQFLQRPFLPLREKISAFEFDSQLESKGIGKENIGKEVITADMLNLSKLIYKSPLYFLNNLSINNGTWQRIDTNLVFDRQPVIVMPIEGVYQVDGGGIVGDATWQIPGGDSLSGEWDTEFYWSYSHWVDRREQLSRWKYVANITGSNHTISLREYYFALGGKFVFP